MEHKIAWFTEGGWEGKVQQDEQEMRNDLSWMYTLDATHHFIGNLPKLDKNMYDIGIITIPKTKIEQLVHVDLIKEMKRVCKIVGTMQEGPHWYFQDFTMEQQVWFYNLLTDADFIWCHNEMDLKYYKGLTNKKCYINPTLMLEHQIKPHIVNSDERSGVMIGGNFCRWYGGFDSYMIAREFGESIYAPSMGRKIDREDEMDITHLPYMTWVDWINNLSKYKYGVHLMSTHAAGTFALNCAYHGIPCIGYKGLDTQEMCFPHLSVDMGDLKKAKQLAERLKTDDDFYNDCSKIAKTRYNECFGQKEYIYTMNKVIGEVTNETN